MSVRESKTHRGDPKGPLVEVAGSPLIPGPNGHPQNGTLTPRQMADLKLGESVSRLMALASADRDNQASLEQMAELLAAEGTKLIEDAECVIACISFDRPGRFRVVGASGPWAGGLRGGEYALEGTLNGRAMLERRVIETLDAPTDSSMPEVFKPGGIHSGRLVPLLGLPELPQTSVAVGVIGFWRRDSRPFTDQERAVTDTYASIVNIGLVRAQIRDMTRRTNEQLQAGIDAAIDLGSSLHPEVVVRKLLERTVASVQADRATLVTVHGDHLRVEGSFDVRGRRHLTYEPGTELPMAVTFQQIVASGDPVMEPYVESDAPERARQAMRGIRQVVTVPLAVDGQPDAALSAMRRRNAPFTKADTAVLQQIGNMAVLALRNANLYGEAQTVHGKAVRTLAAVSRHVQTSSDLPQFFGLLSETVASLVQATRVAFWSYSEETKTLRLEPLAFGFGTRQLQRVATIPVRAGLGSMADRILFREERVRLAIGDHDPEQEPFLARLHALGIPDLISVAWKAGDRSLGVLGAYGSSRPGGFSDEDLWILEIAALAAGLVWQHKASEQRLAAIAAADTAIQREHLERMQTLEEIKSEFLLLASHELRGPLAVVRGYLSMMEEGVMTPERSRRAIDVVVAKTDQMNTLINEMLETARLEEGRLELAPTLHDLRETLASAMRATAPLLGPPHRVQLRQPRQPVMVRADPGRIETILTNIIDNAIKYSPDGGIIRCTLGSRGGVARVRVADPGIGIARDDMDRLFTRFGRLVTPENSHISGTGLGLYLARELALRSGGTLTARSRPGTGSVFTLTLPLAPPPPTR